jgi:hypothetical protein
VLGLVLWRLLPFTVVSGTVRLLVTSPETSEEPIGEPNPVTVFEPLDELPLGAVVAAKCALEPRPLEVERNGKPPKLHQPPIGLKTPGRGAAGEIE